MSPDMGSVALYALLLSFSWIIGNPEVIEERKVCSLDLKFPWTGF
jgi:hypothetical protein